ncbi:MAG: hypothetical protein AAF614_44070 [Chloroflexota bacterium]
MDCLFVIEFNDQKAKAKDVETQLRKFAKANDINIAYLSASQKNLGLVGIISNVTNPDKNLFFEFIRKDVVAKLNGFSDQELGDAMQTPSKPSKLSTSHIYGNAAKWGRASIDEVIEGFDVKGSPTTDADNNPYLVGDIFLGGIGGMH